MPYSFTKLLFYFVTIVITAESQNCIVGDHGEQRKDIRCAGAQFGKQDEYEITGMLSWIEESLDHYGCENRDNKSPTNVENEDHITRIGVVYRGGGCSFADKAILAQKQGMDAMVVINNDDEIFPMGCLEEERANIGSGLVVVMIPRNQSDSLLMNIMGGNGSLISVRFSIVHQIEATESPQGSMERIDKIKNIVKHLVKTKQYEDALLHIKSILYHPTTSTTYATNSQLQQDPSMWLLYLWLKHDMCEWEDVEFVEMVNTCSSYL
jgi:hypothetical protein